MVLPELLDTAGESHRVTWTLVGGNIKKAFTVACGPVTFPLSA